MSQTQILASKICPSLLIGDELIISTRNIKTNKKPPKKSASCNCIFKEFVTHDTTDVTLTKDYNGSICEDIISNEFLLENESFSNGVELKHIIKNKNKDCLNGKRVLIFSTNHKLLTLEDLINKSARHKATEYKLKELTLCNLIQEELNIFNSVNIDSFRKGKLSQVPNDNGYITIEKPTK